MSGQVKTIEFTAPVTSSNPVEVKNEMKGLCKGLWLVGLETVTNPNEVLSAAPFLQFTNGNGVIKITNITGLTSGNKYRATVICLDQL
jgi:hypothetical protein